MNIRHGDEADVPELRRLYRHQHPDIPVQEFSPEVQHESQTFTATDEHERIIGLALVSYLDYGLYPYGVIHELEVEKDNAERVAVTESLVDACLDWLSQRRAMVAYVSATTKSDRALFHELGFNLESSEMSRPVPPQPVRAARQRFN